MSSTLHHPRRAGVRVVVGLLAVAALWVVPGWSPSIAPPASGAVFSRCPVGPASIGGVARFWTDDRTCYDSPWFAGSHRVLIPFGCTRAPYYPRVAACSNRGGIHHGIDIDMPVGTRIYSNVSGRVVKGSLGTAYGPKAFVIRTASRDYVLGHVGTVYVSDGQHVDAGQLVARSNQLGAPDGPHLHFEVRPLMGSYRDAIDPSKALRLTAKPGGAGGCC